MIAVVFKRLLVTCLITCAVTACDRDYKHAPLPATSNIVILGDSLTYGTGAGSGEDYASLLASNTGWNVINAGVPGNTSSDGLARLSYLLEAHEAGEQKIDLLIIELGGNDFLKHVPEPETVDNLKSILNQAKARSIQTALIAIPEFSPVGAAFGALSDHPLYEKLAEETDTPLIEDLFSDVLAKNSLKADPIHPNAEGYRLVASELQSALMDLGFLKKK
jgi:acyl-CoA hydrolase